MKPTSNFARRVLLIIIIFLVGATMYLSNKYGSEATISYTIWYYGRAWPILLIVLGYVLHHFFPWTIGALKRCGCPCKEHNMPIPTGTFEAVAVWGRVIELLLLKHNNWKKNKLIRRVQKNNEVIYEELHKTRPNHSRIDHADIDNMRIAASVPKEMSTATTSSKSDLLPSKGLKEICSQLLREKM